VIDSTSHQIAPHFYSIPEPLIDADRHSFAIVIAIISVPLVFISGLENLKSLLRCFFDLADWQ
jgi:hypothetical protein